MTTHEDLSRAHETDRSTNRSFGCVFAIAFAVIGAWPLFSGEAARWWAFAVSGVLVAITAVAPALLSRPRRLWLRVGLLLNRIVSPIALAILYYGVVTPTGLIMRWLGKDAMRAHREPKPSYWIDRDPPGPKPDSLNHQF